MSDIINKAETIKYNVYNHEDKKVATITENEDKLSLEVFVENIYELPLFLQEASTDKELKRFLSKRVLPDGRHGLEDCLRAEGIKEYNLRDLIILNSGRTLTDSFYVLTEIDGVESVKSTASSIQYIEEFDNTEESLW